MKGHLNFRPLFIRVLFCRKRIVFKFRSYACDLIQFLQLVIIRHIISYHTSRGFHDQYTLCFEIVHEMKT